MRDERGRRETSNKQQQHATESELVRVIVLVRLGSSGLSTFVDGPENNLSH